MPEFHFDLRPSKLRCTHILDGHSGCVNALCWSEDGNTLLSGSDDTKIIFWDLKYLSSDPTSATTVKKEIINTGHTQNIFSAKFFGKDKVVTAAGDAEVRVVNVEKRQVERVYECFEDRAKKVELDAEGPWGFWIVSEEGSIRFFDMRLPIHSCENKECPKPLISTGNAQIPFHSMSICPSASQYMAVGGTEPVVRIFDRRFLSDDPKKNYFDLPAHIWIPPGSDIDFINSVKFNRFSYDLAVSANRDAIYMINPIYQNQPEFLEQIQVFERPRCRSLKDSLRFNEEMLWERMTIRSNLGEFKAAADGWERLIRRHGRLRMIPEFKSMLVYELYMKSLNRCKVPGQSETIVRAAEEDLDAAIKIADDSLEDKLKSVILKAVIELSRESFVNCQSILEPLLHEKLEDHDLTVLIERVYNSARICELDPAQIPSLLRPLKEMCENLKLESPTEQNFYKKLTGSKQLFGGYLDAMKGPRLERTVKDVNFVGSRDEYVVSGSDNGYFFIYPNTVMSELNFESTLPVFIGKSDQDVVNVVEQHPSIPRLAVSGIDNTIKIWEPVEWDSEQLAERESFEESYHRVKEDDYDRVMRELDLESVRSRRMSAVLPVYEYNNQV